MQVLRTYLFPLLMLLGLGVSSLLIVTALEAAPLAGVASEPQMAAQTQAKRQPPSGDLAALGRALFVAKGCVVCHNHPAFRTERLAMGAIEFSDVPSLANLKIDPDYLRRWLHDPKALKPTTWMPNLNLSDDEIDALAAFLKTEGK